MPSPSQSCPDCGRQMTYDPVLSLKVRNSVKVTSFWCLSCSMIIVEKRFDVSNPVVSVRRYIFKGELP